MARTYQNKQVKLAEISRAATPPSAAPPENFVDINKHKLDEEWVKQPKLFRREADALTEARRDLDEAKLEVKIAEVNLEKVMAQLKLRVRKDPEGYGLDKATEASVNEVMLVQAEYGVAQQTVWDAERKVIKIKELVGTLEDGVEALHQKKYGLQDLVKMDARAYWAEPKFQQDNTETGLDRVARRPRDPDDYS